MDKINSGFFNCSSPNLDFFDLRFQARLFVKVPKKTKVKGELGKHLSLNVRLNKQIKSLKFSSNSLDSFHSEKSKLETARATRVIK